MRALTSPHWASIKRGCARTPAFARGDPRTRATNGPAQALAGASSVPALRRPWAVGWIAGPGVSTDGPSDGGYATLHADEPLLGRREPPLEAVEARVQRPRKDGQLPLEPDADALHELVKLVGGHPVARIALPTGVAWILVAAAAHSTLTHQPLPGEYRRHDPVRIEAAAIVNCNGRRFACPFRETWPLDCGMLMNINVFAP